MKLENWSVTYRGDLYTPPELQVPILQGFVTGHPLHDDGKFITTSSIKGLTEDGKVQTRNSVYELGTVDPKWDALYPNAKQRFLDSLAKWVK